MFTSTKSQKTTNKQILFFVISCLIVGTLLLLSAEFMLRIRGFKPWRPHEIIITIDPGEKFFTKHPKLGYTHIPGRFAVTLETGYSFNVSHLPNTQRITHPIDSYEESRQKEEVWIFGCSFTHGWSLNDEETYPWLLQERFPEYEIRNFGVNGYGTIHALVQFRDALKVKVPKVVVLTYMKMDDVRNTFLRIRRKMIAPWNRLGPLVQPYARLDDSGGLLYSIADVEYTEFPMMRHSALIHLIEEKYNAFELKLNRSHIVSQKLVMEIADLAKKHDVDFVLAGISEDDASIQMLEFARENGILNVDISVDLSVKENNNLPHDGHPSATANKHYADKLEAFLRAEFLDIDKQNGTKTDSL